MNKNLQLQDLSSLISRLMVQLFVKKIRFIYHLSFLNERMAVIYASCTMERIMELQSPDESNKQNPLLSHLFK